MRTLLLVDDSVTVQRVVALTFADEAFRVVNVPDGQAAIDRIAAHPPDIVLAGTTVPSVSGYDVARFVRSRPALSGVPVLLLSGAFESVDPERLKASGANGVIEKPLEPTIVISRVKELLGMTAEPTPTPTRTGRMVTSDDPAAGGQPRAPRVTASAPASARPVAVAAPPPASWEDLRQDTGLGPDAGSVEGSDRAGRADYLDTLDSAFDSLDQHLAGRTDQARNPAPPLGRQAGSADPRSPQRPPAAGAKSPHQIFEVDDDWFADADKTREDRREEHQQLAAEMGIHEVELPDATGAAAAAPPDADLDFHFDLDAVPAAPVDAPAPVEKPAPAANTDADRSWAPAAPERPPVARVAPPPAPAPIAAPAAPAAYAAPVAAPVQPAPPAPYAVARASASAPVHPAPPPMGGDVADDFAALLAFEQGERPHPPAAPAVSAVPSVTVQVPPPEITTAMLDQIAARVVERLNAGPFADQLRDAMTDTVRDTVRSVVSETSERLVRDEIARIKTKAGS